VSVKIVHDASTGVLDRRDDGKGLRRCGIYWGVRITWRGELVRYAVTSVVLHGAASKQRARRQGVVSQLESKKRQSRYQPFTWRQAEQLNKTL